MAIAIIDYGMGNIHSVRKALEIYGAKTIVTNSPAGLDACEKIVFPGVGAFDDAMLELKKRGLSEAIKKQVNAKKPFLGICLGMQCLFENSQEAKREKGLGLFKGSVKKFSDAAGLKVPHMGWNQLKFKIQNSNIKNGCALLKGVIDGSFAYFCHSYYVEPQDKEVAVSLTEYGADFASFVSKGNLFGVQFHPEKSSSTGLKILENFVEI